MQKKSDNNRFPSIIERSPRGISADIPQKRNGNDQSMQAFSCLSSQFVHNPPASRHVARDLDRGFDAPLQGLSLPDDEPQLYNVMVVLSRLLAHYFYSFDRLAV